MLAGQTLASAFKPAEIRNWSTFGCSSMSMLAYVVPRADGSSEAPPAN